MIIIFLSPLGIKSFQSDLHHKKTLKTERVLSYQLNTNFLTVHLPKS